LASRTPRLVTLNPGTILHRFWTLTDPAAPTIRFDPIYFDRSLRGRLNAPDFSYGVLYTAKEALGAFSETFLRSSGRQSIDPGLVVNRGYVRLTVLRPLRLIDFDGPSLAALGATAAVTHSDPPYDIPQAWSQALRAHPIGVDGIAYSGRHDNHQICYALFEGPVADVVEASREEDLDQTWFWDLADHYEIGLAPR
jgi:hypothetical protein